MSGPAEVGSADATDCMVASTFTEDSGKVRSTGKDPVKESWFDCAWRVTAEKVNYVIGRDFSDFLVQGFWRGAGQFTAGVVLLYGGYKAVDGMNQFFNVKDSIGPWAICGVVVLLSVSLMWKGGRQVQNALFDNTGVSDPYDSMGDYMASDVKALSQK